VRQPLAATPYASIIPTSRAALPPLVPSPLVVVIFPYPPWTESLLVVPTTDSVSVMPRARFNLFSSPPCCTPRRGTSAPLVVSPHAARFPDPTVRMRLAHAYAACVSAYVSTWWMRTCVSASKRASVRPCNNNKKRATLWGTNGLRPVHPMLGGAGLIPSMALNSRRTESAAVSRRCNRLEIRVLFNIEPYFYSNAALVEYISFQHI